MGTSIPELVWLGPGLGWSGLTPVDRTLVTPTALDGAVRLNWTDVPTATGYRVGRNGTDTTGAGPWTTEVDAGTRTITFDKLINNTSYTFTVQPLPDKPVTTVTAIPVGAGEPPPPPPPQDLTVTAVASDGAIAVTWDYKGTAAITGFQVGRDGVDSGGSGAWSTIDPATARTRTFDKLVNGNEYTITVQALPGGTPVAIKRTPNAGPVTETSVTAQASDRTVDINWTGVTDATGYRVGYTPQGGSASTPVEVGAAIRTYRFANLTNGTAHTFRVKPLPESLNSPEKTVSATPNAAPARSLEVVGRSGMSWNSLVFGHGAIPTGFESWRRRPVDGAMVFPYRLEQSGMLDTPARRAGDILVWAIPAFVQGKGFNNQQVAAGQHDAFIKQMAQKQASVGWNTNRTIIRLNWEQNGNWYEWSWDRPGGTASSIAAFRRFVDIYRANGMNKCLFSWNLNKGPQPYNAGYSWTQGYPGDQWTDIVGLDSYDAYGPQRNESEWTRETVGRNPGLVDVLEFVKARGKLMAVEEWGVCWRSPDGQMVGGGDNPWYVGRMFEFLKANARWVAYDVTYDDDGAPNTLRHKLSTGNNPNAAARYRQPWPNGWGG